MASTIDLRPTLNFQASGFVAMSSSHENATIAKADQSVLQLVKATDNLRKAETDYMQTKATGKLQAYSSAVENLKAKNQDHLTKIQAVLQSRQEIVIGSERAKNDPVMVTQFAESLKGVAIALSSAKDQHNKVQQKHKIALI